MSVAKERKRKTMQGQRLPWVLPLILFFAIAGYSVASSSQAPDSEPVLTNSLTAVSASQSAELGQQGVTITYHNTGSQALHISLQSSVIKAGQDGSYFFGPSSLSSRTYTARLLSAQSNGVPLSTTTTVQVKL